MPHPHTATRRSLLAAATAWLAAPASATVAIAAKPALLLAQEAPDNLHPAGWLVSEGQAWSYHWRHSNGPYAEQEERAREGRKGLFAEDRPEVPRDFRRSNGPCPWP